jgi:trehalose utilization protein
VAEAPNVPVERAPEPLTAKGGSLHKPGEEGYR